MIRYVSVYIGSNDEFNFFYRMSRGLSEKGLKLLFVSNKLSIILKAILYGFKYHLIKSVNNGIPIPDLSNCYDLKAGLTSCRKAEILYASVYKSFEEVYLKYSPEYVFIWNGLSIQTLAVSDFCNKHSLKTRFFELSNLPGKFFVNPSGVNAKSGLYENPEVLKKYSVSEKDYLSWKESYILTSLEPKYISRKKKKNYLFPLDLIGFRFFCLPENGETNFRKKLKELLPDQLRIIYDDYDISRNNYIFLPLQLNLDTQLLFNSDVNNFEAIEAGMRIAEENGIDLVLKLHPLEKDNVFISQILNLKERLKFYLVNISTTDLILSSESVLTINSTVGLETLVLKKPVKFLGRSFYPRLEGEYLRNFILGYLVDGEYSSGNSFSNQAVEKILNIC